MGFKELFLFEDKNYFFKEQSILLHLMASMVSCTLSTLFKVFLPVLEVWEQWFHFSKAYHYLVAFLAPLFYSLYSSWQEPSFLKTCQYFSNLLYRELYLCFLVWNSKVREAYNFRLESAFYNVLIHSFGCHINDFLLSIEFPNLIPFFYWHSIWQMRVELLSIVNIWLKSANLFLSFYFFFNFLLDQLVSLLFMNKIKFV